MDLHQVKAILQSHFSDGCAVIIGSGLSCAEGLPGMGALAAHLSANLVADRLTNEDLTLWRSIEAQLATDGLEKALLSNAPTNSLEATIREETVRCILSAERRVIAEVFRGERVLALSRLIPRIVKPVNGLPIITTNYDRLAEIASEIAGLGADNMFSGRFLGSLNERESRLSFCRDHVLRNGKRVELRYAPRSLIYKPHGSLDWYLKDGAPIYYPGEIEGATRLIITPGHNKFRNGYDSPFDAHRGRANDAIDKASRFIVIGYGFNDDHLETHLSPAIRGGKPTLIITKGLSDVAISLARDHKNVIGIDEGTNTDPSGTRVVIQQEELFFPGLRLWDLNSFITEILEP